MRLFPNRTLEEIDDLDLARHMAAMEAAETERQARVVVDWMHGKGKADELKAVAPEIKREVVRIRGEQKSHD